MEDNKNYTWTISKDVFGNVHWTSIFVDEVAYSEEDCYANSLLGSGYSYQCYAEVLRSVDVDDHLMVLQDLCNEQGVIVQFKDAE